MDKYKLVIGVILIFIIGVLTGSLGMGFYLKKHMRRFAGGGPTPPMRTEILMERLSGKLDLTDAQRVEVEKLIKETQKKITELRRNILPEIDDINKQSFSIIKDILDDKQKEKLEGLYQKVKGLIDKSLIQIISEETTDSVMAKMKESLSLSPDQENKVYPIIKKSVQERKKITETYKNQGPPEIFSLMPELREIDISVDRELESILTEKQMDKYKQMNRRPRHRMRPDMGLPGLGLPKRR